MDEWNIWVSGCGYQEAGVVVRNWVWLQCSWWVSGVVRRYLDFLILLISTPLVLAVFAAVSRLICSL